MREGKTLKIIVVGEQGVGKSSLLLRYLKREFRPEYSITIGVEFSTKPLVLDGCNVSLQIWDTAGQEAFRSIVKNFYKGAQAVLLSFSLTSRQSFQNLRFWIKDIEQNSSPYVYKVLVGTKTDLVAKREVSAEEMEKFMGEAGIQLSMETSALENSRVDQLFQQCVRAMLRKEQSSQQFAKLIAATNQTRLNLLAKERLGMDVQERRGRKAKKCC